MDDAPPVFANRVLLKKCLDSGRLLIGQVLLGTDYSLRHADDADRHDLTPYSVSSGARLIARYDDEGNFRPLKTAPNLRRGWLISAASLEEMELALEHLYPSALGLWNAFLTKNLHATSMRETLDRQTGMYRITQLLTPLQAGELVARCCRFDGGCLRSILWDLAPAEPITSLPESKLSLESLPAGRIPLICRELCNLVVAAARPIAKGNLPKKE